MNLISQSFFARNLSLMELDALIRLPDAFKWRAEEIGRGKTSRDIAMEHCRENGLNDLQAQRVYHVYGQWDAAQEYNR